MANRLPSEWRNVDYYAELGVAKDATFDDVSRRYRTLAKQLHPDVRPDDPNAAARFARVSAAHEVLADPVRRHDYDIYRRSLSGDRGPREPRLRTAPEPGRPAPRSNRAAAPRRQPNRENQPLRSRSGFIAEFASRYPFAFAIIVVVAVIVLVSTLSGAARHRNDFARRTPVTTSVDAGNRSGPASP